MADDNLIDGNRLGYPESPTAGAGLMSLFGQFFPQLGSMGTMAQIPTLINLLIQRLSGPAWSLTNPQFGATSTTDILMNQMDMASRRTRNLDVQIGSLYGSPYTPLGILGGMASHLADKSSMFINYNALAQQHIGGLSAMPFYRDALSIQAAQGDLSSKVFLTRLNALGPLQGSTINEQLINSGIRLPSTSAVESIYSRLLTNYRAGNKDFLQTPYDLGTLGGVGAEYMRTAGGGAFGKSGVENAVRNIQELSSAVSDWQRLLGGELMPLLDKLSETFGSSVLATFRNNEARLQQYAGAIRHTARITGYDPNQILNASAQLGGTLTRIGGTRMGALTAGLMTMQSLGLTDAYGIDEKRFASMQGTRIAGAMESDYARQISGAYKLFRDQQADAQNISSEVMMARFEKRLTEAAEGNIGNVGRLDVLRKVLNTPGLTRSDLMSVSNLEEAIEYRTQNTLATRAAKFAQTGKLQDSIKREVLRISRAQGINLTEDQLTAITSGSREARDRALSAAGINTVNAGEIQNVMNRMAQRAGYQDYNYMAQSMQADKRSIVTEQNVALRRSFESQMRAAGVEVDSPFRAVMGMVRNFKELQDLEEREGSLTSQEQSRLEQLRKITSYSTVIGSFTGMTGEQGKRIAGVLLGERGRGIDFKKLNIAATAAVRDTGYTAGKLSKIALEKFMTTVNPKARKAAQIAYYGSLGLDASEAITIDSKTNEVVVDDSKIKTIDTSTKEGSDKLRAIYKGIYKSYTAEGKTSTIREELKKADISFTDIDMGSTQEKRRLAMAKTIMSSREIGEDRKKELLDSLQKGGITEKHRELLKSFEEARKEYGKYTKEMGTTPFESGLEALVNRITDWIKSITSDGSIKVKTQTQDVPKS